VNQIVAAVRFDDSSVRLLREDAFEALLSLWGTDNTMISSLHAFVAPRKGSGTVYRNSYAITDDIGRSATSTLSYTLPTMPEEDSSCMMDLTQIVPHRSIATSLNKVMDAATSNIVRYIEVTQSVRVLEVHVDYVIDSKSQLWMLWPSDIRLVTPTMPLKELRIPELARADIRGRVSWIGNAAKDWQEFPVSRSRSRPDAPPVQQSTRNAHEDHLATSALLERAAQAVEGLDDMPAMSKSQSRGKADPFAPL
jgi:hypothetical protein